MQPELARKLPTGLDRLLRFTAVFLIPFSMVLASVIAAFVLDRMYPQVSGEPVMLRALPTSERVALDPLTAYQTLSEMPTAHSATSSQQAWLLADVPEQHDFNNYVIEIPSRHVTSLICWDTATMSVIGAASRRSTTPDIRMAKLGFTVNMGQLDAPRQVLCYGTFTDNHQLSARLWTESGFRMATSRFDHGMGLLEGGLLTPAIFALIIGIIAKQSTYAVLAAWLVANLRLGAFAIGWDTQWLGYLLPLEAMPYIRQATAAIYYLLTVALLIRLLRASNYTEHPRLLGLTKGSALLLLLCAALPGTIFWHAAGIIGVLGLIAAFFLLTRVIKQTGLAIWFWQVTSLALAFSILIGLSALLIFGDINDLDSLFTTVLLLISSATMVLSLAERLRNTRSEQQRLHTELVTSYAISPIGMFTLDAQERFIRMNPVLESMLGFNIAQHPDARWTDYFPALDWEELTQKAHANEDVEITAKKRHSSDKTKHFAIRAVIVDKKIEGSLQDISAHTALIEQLRVLAGKDPVTEALNQRSLEEAVAQALSQLKNTPACLLYLNVGHFKNIRSLFGYSIGDALLSQTRRKISANLNVNHELGRTGSDEFAILFPGHTAKEIEPVVEDLTEKIENHLFSVCDHAINIKVAAGLIDLSPDLDDAKEALFTAGRACRDALKDQRRVVTYKSGSTALKEHRELLLLFDQLESGSTPDGFQLYLQPMLSTRAPADACCFEALLRVRDSENNPLPAGRVIAAAEDIGTITSIDRWVLETVLGWLDEHGNRLSSLRMISVNISGLSLSSDAFIEHMFRLLERYRHLTHHLIIEMTEGVALQNLERSQSVIRRLQEQGVRIGLDDFGAGYTSFSYLRNLKADVIKIDGSLIQNMLADPDNIAIVRTIIQLAHQLKMTCIAEWVEDGPTMEALHKLGVDYMQGFFISPARPLDDVLKSKTIFDFLTTDESRARVRRIIPKKS